MGLCDWAARPGVGRVGKEEERITSAFPSSFRLIISPQVGSPWERRHNFTTHWTLEAASVSWRLMSHSSGRPRATRYFKIVAHHSRGNFKQRWATFAWIVETQIWTRGNRHFVLSRICCVDEDYRSWNVQQTLDKRWFFDISLFVFANHQVTGTLKKKLLPYSFASDPKKWFINTATKKTLCPFLTAWAARCSWLPWNFLNYLTENGILIAVTDLCVTLNHHTLYSALYGKTFRLSPFERDQGSLQTAAAVVAQ